MIYVEEKYNITPASPETLDKFVKFAQEHFVPTSERLGARLIAAWSNYVEWYCQVIQIMEFDNFNALKLFRVKSAQDSEWGEYQEFLEEIAPERTSRLLEPLGPVPPDVLHEAIAKSQKKPLNVYGLAILNVLADHMAEFKSGLSNTYKNLPIIASWRPIAGYPNEVIDLWATRLLPRKYTPATNFDKQFFRPLRKIAPKERLVTVFSLPHSPLR